MTAMERAERALALFEAMNTDEKKFLVKRIAAEIIEAAEEMRSECFKRAGKRIAGYRQAAGPVASGYPLPWQTVAASEANLIRNDILAVPVE